MRTHKVIAALLVILGSTMLLAQTQPAAGSAPNMFTLQSASPLYEVQIMVRAGSAADPAGEEGTAQMAARALIEGGFGSPQNPVTKEKLAEITRPWGDAAYPTVMVDKESTTFSMTVPRESWKQFVTQVLKPMFTQPLWQPAEIDRLRKEALTRIQSNLRFEQQELLGLLALDNYVFDGTPLQNLSAGTVRGLQAVTRDDLKNFYKRYYTRGNMFIAASVADAQDQNLLQSALPAGAGAAPQTEIKPQVVEGRQVLMITQPNAIATGLHLGFPINVKRGDPDYWPLFVANAYLGQHRDSFGLLYQKIREQRGYNYGDYSYIEYLSARPYSLFPPPTTPRQQQYFSLWIRPVGHQYAHFIMKAMTAELDRFIQQGLTPEQVDEAKVKVRTLYLNFAESKGRQLGYKLDDMFYGTRDNGYLDTMLRSVDAVTAEQVNAAIKKHLQTANLKYVLVTNQSEAEKLADDIANNTNVTSKTPEEYHMPTPVPPDKQKILDQDKQWAAYPLNVPRANIRIVKAEQMFETAGLATAASATGGAQ